MPVRVFIFDDRVEIHSPGNLPAGMTVESMVAGVSMPRNDLLFNNAIYLLPYTGAGSGLRRAMDTGVEVQFDDNEKTREFVITIPRREHHVKNAPSNGEMHHENAPSSEKTHQLTKKQTDIINFCSIPRSSIASAIFNRLLIWATLNRPFKGTLKQKAKSTERPQRRYSRHCLLPELRKSHVGCVYRIQNPKGTVWVIL